MKKFKKLQDNVNESLNSIRDEQLLKSLKHQNECLNKKAASQKHKSFRFAMVSSCIAAILIVAILCNVLPSPGSSQFINRFNSNPRAMPLS